jgi:GT2 family glycosyltransferase
MTVANVAVIVPTLGRSPFLNECLERLRAEIEPAFELIVVQPAGALELDTVAADQVLESPERLGFAAACNLGISHSSSEFVALVNDDALIEPGWLRALLGALEEPDVAAVQGINLVLSQPAVVDGCGVAWNRFWRPIQIGSGLPQPRLERPVEIFGVSATAAIYRRSALRRAEIAQRGIFDPLLISYYEDVELALRLRALGYRSLCVPAARTLHAGSTTAKQQSYEHVRLMTSNRYLVLARALGKSFRTRWPLLLARDLLDLSAHIGRFRLSKARGLLAGWRRALRKLDQFKHSGGGADAIAALAGFRLQRAASWPESWRVEP